MTNLKSSVPARRATGSSFDVEHVLEVIMDLVLGHVQADRGIILLLDEKKNELVPKVVRTRDEGTPQGRPSKPVSVLSPEPFAAPEAKIQASRTIINHVITTGEGVLSSNAMTDQRFSKGKSVHNLGIRSALCVPIKARKLDEASTPASATTIIGVIYIDSSVKNYTYSPDQLRLLTAIGLQAGLALQNAKLFQQGLEAERLAAIGRPPPRTRIR